MMIRYIALVSVFLFATTGLANAQEWRHVRTYRGPTCHCGSHACGTTWMEGGTLHRCRAAGTADRSGPKRKKK
jgi:hypothetical protein